MTAWRALMMATFIASSGPAHADAGFVHVLPNVALAQPCGADDSCAYTWTLATRLGDALRYAELRYGKRDMSWTLLGIEFTSEETPQIWYPGYDDGRKHVVVQLTASTARNELQALYQLSHEVMHLLSPNGPDETVKVFEEGLAAYNSIDYTRSVGFDITAGYIASPPYEAAYAAIAELEAAHPDFANGVKALRTRHHSLSAVSAEDLLAEFPAISGALAERLAAPF